MGIQIIGNGGVVGDVGGTTFRAQHTHVKPLEYAALGHYRCGVRFTMATTQATDSRLWQVRNTSTNLIIPTRLLVQVMSAGTVNAAYRFTMSLFKPTSFTAVDTTNTVTPAAVVKRTTEMGVAPGNVDIRHVTVAGAAAGMTGGTLTRGNVAGIMIAWVATAAATTFPIEKEFLDDVNGTHPFVLKQNEGLLLENTQQGSGTANVVDVSVDFSWAEVAAF